MKTARAAAVLALLAGLVSAEIQNLDLLRLLMERPPLAGHNRFDRGPSIEDRIDQLWHRKYGEEDTGYNEDLSGTSRKRSAVATALNSGRPRRQQPSALGKAATPFASVGILNNMDTFFQSLHGNLAVQASLSPVERAHFYDPPTVVQPASSDLTTADPSSKTTYTLEPTGTTRGCCGRALGGRRLVTYAKRLPTLPSSGRFLGYRTLYPRFRKPQQVVI